MSDIWHSLPAEFKFDDPERPITVWRGDRVGKLATGMTARLEDDDPEAIVLAAARKGSDALHKLVDRHTSGSEGSPLISVTTDLRLAQLFADKPGTTIYEATMTARRLVRDPYNTGTKRWPLDTEMFVVGHIPVDEITGVKLNNENGYASELNFEINGRPGYRASFFSDFSRIPTPDKPNPNGVWQRK